MAEPNLDDEPMTDDDGPTPEEEARRLRERLSGIVNGLEQEATLRVGKREIIERRWLADLQQFHGVYDEKTRRELENADKSTLFINQTRPKTNAAKARLADMLFPTDDRNWGIQPTPVPELTVEAEMAARRSAELKQEAAQSGDPQAQQMAAEAEAESDDLEAQMDEARQRARAMEEEIEDHLKQCQYQAQSRDVISDACEIGTGILKGPVIGGRSRRAWQQDEETGEQMLQQVEDARPVYWRVDPWSWFPDFSARRLEECESTFERHLMTKKELRRLAREPGFDKDAIRELLMSEPRQTLPYWIADLRRITGTYHDDKAEHFHVWEYHGPLTAEDLKTVAEAMNQPEMAEAALGEDEIDPLDELNVILWFCDGRLIKFGIHPLDSGESLYSVYCLDDDPASVFGFGIPFLMRDSQKALSAAWRMMMDNAGLSTGPQIVVNRDVVEPADDKWGLTPRKIWYRKNSAPEMPAFETYNIESHQEQLANIITMSRQFIDDETSVSQVAQGEQGTHTTQTAQGMSILMNATNVVFRRMVKRWDDDVTTPTIRRLYDWLMQFSPKDYIKGDFDVDARGTSVLLVRELQSQNLMAFLSNFAGHPVLGRFLKQDGVNGLRKLAQTMQLAADELVKTDEEIEQDNAQMAEQQPPPDPAMLKVQAEYDLADMKHGHEMERLQFERDTRLMELAEKFNWSLEELSAKLAQSQADRETKERIVASEAAVAERTGKHAGGYV